MERGRRQKRFTNNRLCSYCDSRAGSSSDSCTSNYFRSKSYASTDGGLVSSFALFADCSIASLFLFVALISLLSYLCPARCLANYETQPHGSLKEDLRAVSNQLRHLRLSYSSVENQMSKLTQEVARLEGQVEILNEVMDLISSESKPSINLPITSKFIENISEFPKEFVEIKE